MVFFPLVLATAMLAAQPADNIGHTRHLHHDNEKHPTTAPTRDRFITTRASDVILPLPEEKDAFTFVVFGDRTGGPADGVGVLADAVRDTNLLEPDFVITVGDLVQGYNTSEVWQQQMTEFKGIMNELICPWFPVAGNHDIYWRGPNRPAREHEGDFEMHFGPLWYAFEHKNCWFIALHSDEGDPATGQFSFDKPEGQRMSEAQFAFLKDALHRAKDADHVFLFLHHPRWLGGRYGDDWDRVHQLLLDAGNVTAVFAGHIHRMRYDPKDGIDYVTLATVGGGQDGAVPDAGWLHQFHIVTVRKQQVALASVPVGEVMDVRELTGKLADECNALSKSAPKVDAALLMGSQGQIDQVIELEYANTTSQEIEVTFAPDSADSRWIYSPDHQHARVAAGESVKRTFAVYRAPEIADRYYRELEIVTDVDVLLPGHRYALPTRHDAVRVNAKALPEPKAPATDLAMAFDGDDALVVNGFNLPEGPMTVECWMRADEFGDRVGLLCKTESSDYGIFVNRGRAEFSVFLGNAYVAARSQPEVLRPGRWYHIAGVYDGAEVRLYVDGAKVAGTPGFGARKTNRLPLIIGADVGGDGAPNSFFKGRIDSVRLSSKAMYTGESFSPERRLKAGEGVELLTNMDAMFGQSVWGEGKMRFVGRLFGNPELAPAE